MAAGWLEYLEYDTAGGESAAEVYASAASGGGRTRDGGGGERSGECFRKRRHSASHDHSGIGGAGDSAGEHSKFAIYFAESRDAGINYGADIASERLGWWLRTWRICTADDGTWRDRWTDERSRGAYVSSVAFDIVWNFKTLIKN